MDIGTLILNRKYMLEVKLGGGSFGDVFRGMHISNS
jgi:hypothetical protein